MRTHWLVKVCNQSSKKSHHQHKVQTGKEMDFRSHMLPYDMQLLWDVPADHFFSNFSFVVGFVPKIFTELLLCLALTCWYGHTECSVSFCLQGKKRFRRICGMVRESGASSATFIHTLAWFLVARRACYRWRFVGCVIFWPSLLWLGIFHMHCFSLVELCLTSPQVFVWLGNFWLFSVTDIWGKTKMFVINPSYKSCGIQWHPPCMYPSVSYRYPPLKL